LLLPADLRESAYALYAFCRLTDDMIDVDGGSQPVIARLRQRLDLVYRGLPIDDPVDRVFADVVAHYDIPKDLPAALIDGLEWDVKGVVCENIDGVFAYAACVAGSVGAMMAILMGVRSAELVARACDLGIAMQLTNIARDVGEDARMGRLYLPRDWMQEAGLEPQQWLRAPVFTPALGSVIRRLLETADQIYRRADCGIASLPRSYRPGIFAARYIYHSIGLQVAINGFDSVKTRARVSTSAKLGLVCKAYFTAFTSSDRPSNYQPLAQAAHLITAATSSYAPPIVQKSNLADRITDRIVWVATLFAELEARERGRTNTI
jgi:15-cis-phytoene synthase